MASSFNRSGCPVFGVMRVRIPSKHDGPGGHAKRRVPEREIVCDRRHEPVAGQAFPCSHGPSAVPHAGTAPPLPRRGRGFSVFRTHRRRHGKEIVGIRPVSADRPILPADRGRTAGNIATPAAREWPAWSITSFVFVIPPMILVAGMDLGLGKLTLMVFG